uniref:Uncharacterized protein n=1 Tax=Rhizophora mucronata TaxID=61149 RepID=A0A2P2NHT3_RHIMU
MDVSLAIHHLLQLPPFSPFPLVPNLLNPTLPPMSAVPTLPQPTLLTLPNP